MLCESATDERADDGSKSRNSHSDSYEHCSTTAYQYSSILKSRMYLLGFLSFGAAAAMVVNAPFKSPAPPIPCTALPPMSILDEVADPQIIDPIKKIALKVTYVCFQSQHVDLRRRLFTVPLLGSECKICLSEAEDSNCEVCYYTTASLHNQRPTYVETR